MFESGGKKRDKEEFLSIQKEMVSEKSWIIEGCSISTLEMRLAETDILIYFHFSRFLCIWRTLKRCYTRDRHLSETGCANIINWRLLKYIWTFDKEKGDLILKLKKKYPQVEFFVLKKPQDAYEFLKKRSKQEEI
jgi:adenylate kinase family enzyme